MKLYRVAVRPRGKMAAMIEPCTLEWQKVSRYFREPLATIHGIWKERKSLLLRLTSPEGYTGYGEIAPLPWFGTESLEAVFAWLEERSPTITWPEIVALPPTMLCLRSALGCGWLAAMRQYPPLLRQSLRLSALLPSGRKAVMQMDRLLEEGFTCFKWKIQTSTFEEDLATVETLLHRLPEGAVLRLDANGSLSESSARRFLQQFSPHPQMAFLEQPLHPRFVDSLRRLLEEFGPKIALDESVTGWSSLLRADGWGAGALVVKPALLGDWAGFLAGRQALRTPLVYSTALETGIGLAWAALLAGGDRYALPAGLGIDNLFLDDGLGLPLAGPTLDLTLLDSAYFDDLWNRVGASGSRFWPPPG